MPIEAISGGLRGARLLPTAAIFGPACARSSSPHSVGYPSTDRILGNEIQIPGGGGGKSQLRNRFTKSLRFERSGGCAKKTPSYNHSRVYTLKLAAR